MSDMRAEIVEVGPRDGLQNESAILPPALRAALIERLAEAGLRRIEAASFVSARRVPAMAEPEAVLAQTRAPGVALSGLCLNARGVERALETQLAEINLVVLASDTFNRRNQGVGREETLAALCGLIPAIRAAGRKACVTIGAAFGCPFEGETDPGLIAAMGAELADAGAQEIALADTIGVAVPRDVRMRLARLAAAAGPGVDLRAHFHDTRATGIANALAALEAGITRLDAAVGGFGGCPFAPAATGNIATEDLAYALSRSGVETGLDLDRLIAVAHWLAERLNRPAPGALARAGGFPSRARPETLTA